MALLLVSLATRVARRRHESNDPSIDPTGKSGPCATRAQFYPVQFSTHTCYSPATYLPFPAILKCSLSLSLSRARARAHAREIV